MHGVIMTAPVQLCRITLRSGFDGPSLSLRVPPDTQVDQIRRLAHEHFKKKENLNPNDPNSANSNPGRLSYQGNSMASITLDPITFAPRLTTITDCIGSEITDSSTYVINVFSFHDPSFNPFLLPAHLVSQRVTRDIVILPPASSTE